LEGPRHDPSEQGDFAADLQVLLNSMCFVAQSQTRERRAWGKGDRAYQDRERPLPAWAQTSPLRSSRYDSVISDSGTSGV